MQGTGVPYNPDEHAVYVPDTAPGAPEGHLVSDAELMAVLSSPSPTRDAVLVLASFRKGAADAGFADCWRAASHRWADQLASCSDGDLRVAAMAAALPNCRRLIARHIAYARTGARRVLWQLQRAAHGEFDGVGRAYAVLFGADHVRDLPVAEQRGLLAHPPPAHWPIGAVEQAIKSRTSRRRRTGAGSSAAASSAASVASGRCPSRASTGTSVSGHAEAGNAEAASAGSAHGDGSVKATQAAAVQARARSATPMSSVSRTSVVTTPSPGAAEGRDKAAMPASHASSTPAKPNAVAQPAKFVHIPVEPVARPAVLRTSPPMAGDAGAGCAAEAAATQVQPRIATPPLVSSSDDDSRAGRKAATGRRTEEPAAEVEPERTSATPGKPVPSAGAAHAPHLVLPKAASGRAEGASPRANAAQPPAEDLVGALPPEHRTSGLASGGSPGHRAGKRRRLASTGSATTHPQPAQKRPRRRRRPRAGSVPAARLGCATGGSVTGVSTSTGASARVAPNAAGNAAAAAPARSQAAAPVGSHGPTPAAPPTKRAAAAEGACNLYATARSAMDIAMATRMNSDLGTGFTEAERARVGALPSNRSTREPSGTGHADVDIDVSVGMGTASTSRPLAVQLRVTS